MNYKKNAVILAYWRNMCNFAGLDSNYNYGEDTRMRYEYLVAIVTSAIWYIKKQNTYGQLYLGDKNSCKCPPKTVLTRKNHCQKRLQKVTICLIRIQPVQKTIETINPHAYESKTTISVAVRHIADLRGNPR